MGQKNLDKLENFIERFSWVTGYLIIGGILAIFAWSIILYGLYNFGMINL